MLTTVGPWIVSTVGVLVHPKDSGSSERSDAEYLADNPLGADVGYDRKFETYVFPWAKHAKCEEAGCNCDHPTPDDWCEADGIGANSYREARDNHMAMCRKYATTGADQT